MSVWEYSAIGDQSGDGPFRRHANVWLRKLTQFFRAPEFGPTVVRGALAGTTTPGSFTVPTGYFSIFVGRLTLTGTQRATLAGTARLRIL